VFFGESLPKRFFTLKEQDAKEADLVLVLGTSLAVYPFAGVKDEVSPFVHLRLPVTYEKLNSSTGLIWLHLLGLKTDKGSA
jgi:NAD+-dependent protein deacetylase sirtuin 2